MESCKFIKCVFGGVTIGGVATLLTTSAVDGVGYVVDNPYFGNRGNPYYSGLYEDSEMHTCKNSSDHTNTTAEKILPVRRNE